MGGTKWTPYPCLWSGAQSWPPQCAKIWVDACTSRVSTDEWQSHNWSEICLSRRNYNWNGLPKWNRASRKLRSIHRWSGVRFRNWESIWCSNVWGLCRELSSSSSSSWIPLTASPRHVWSVSRRFHQVRNERKTTNSTHPIRRAIEDGSVPLSHSWLNFLALPDNKSDLGRCLSGHIIVNTPPDKVNLFCKINTTITSFSMSFLWRHFEAEDGKKNNKHSCFQHVKLL